MVISSQTESFGLAALEAMACNVPVLATKTGGLPEVVEDEVSGMLYEIGDISRFPTVQSFCSYSRLVKCPKESAGKLYGYGGQKMGNAHLKWAFSEATALFMRESKLAKAFVAKHEKKHGKGKAMSILAHRLGRAVYFVIKRKDAFDVKYFFR
jgi:transposase